jgi:hypothetical protein
MVQIKKEISTRFSSQAEACSNQLRTTMLLATSKAQKQGRDWGRQL